MTWIVLVMLLLVGGGPRRPIADTVLVGIIMPGHGYELVTERKTYRMHLYGLNDKDRLYKMFGGAVGRKMAVLGYRSSWGEGDWFCPCEIRPYHASGRFSTPEWEKMVRGKNAG